MTELNGTRERAAFYAGVEAFRQMALVAAVSIEVRGDAGRVQNQAAVAALQALAEGGRDLMLASMPTASVKPETLNQRTP